MPERSRSCGKPRRSAKRRSRHSIQDLLEQASREAAAEAKRAAGKRRVRRPAEEDPGSDAGTPEGSHCSRQDLEVDQVLEYTDELLIALDDANIQNQFTARVWNAIHSLRSLSMSMRDQPMETEDAAGACGTPDEMTDQEDVNDTEYPEDYFVYGAGDGGDTNARPPLPEDEQPRDLSARSHSTRAGHRLVAVDSRITPHCGWR